MQDSQDREDPTPDPPGIPLAAEAPAPPSPWFPRSSTPGSDGPPGGYGTPSAYGTAGAYGTPGGPEAPIAPSAPGGYGSAGPYGPPGTPGYPGPKGRKGGTGRFLVLALVATVAAAAGAGAVLALHGGWHSITGSAQRLNYPTDETTTISPATVRRVEKKVELGMVDITSHMKYASERAMGTGMVITSSGLVLTNNHVVEQSTRLTATVVTTGRSYRLQVLGTDATDDVALLKLVGAPRMNTVETGNSNKVLLGTPVVALGNSAGQGGLPLTYPGTVTALDRAITATDPGSRTSEHLFNMLQTDTQIVPGDSGGPLVTTSGQVIGMDTAANTQGKSGSGQSTSEGFAIPINRALAIVRQIAAGRGSQAVALGRPAFIGIDIASTPNGSVSTLASPRAQLRQLEAAARDTAGGVNASRGCMINSTSSPVPATIAPAASGTLVGGLLCRTPAQAAGMKAGDVITKIGSRAVTSPASLRTVMTHLRPGESVPITWITINGQHRTAPVTLTAGPAD